MKRFHCLLLALVCGVNAIAQKGYKEVYKLPCENAPYVSSTRYNYSRVAEQLTQGRTTDLEKIEAIYDWMTRNIAYDTSYQIHTADECFDAKKGVCQGYCELFYRIAEAAGLRVEIINGISRDIFGRVSDAGHAWLFAYTRGNYGILIDPTWDAGTVNGGVFTRADYHRSWFGVDPKWMILRHFPKDPSYQLLPRMMSEEEFRSLNYEFSCQYVYGFDVDEIYTRARNHTLSMPQFFSGGAGDITVLEAPLQAELRVGQSYTFRVKVITGKELILTAGKWYSNRTGGWISEGDNVFSITFTPEVAGQVRLNVRNQDSDGRASTLILYTVPAPTEEEILRLEKARQASLKEVRLPDSFRHGIEKDMPGHAVSQTVQFPGRRMPV